MAKDATGMVEDHYDGPDITEEEEEIPPPQEEKKQKIRDSYLQQQQEKPPTQSYDGADVTAGNVSKEAQPIQVVKKETKNITAPVSEAHVTKSISAPNDSENHNAVATAEAKIASSQNVANENVTNEAVKGDIHSLVNKAAFTPLSPKGKPDTITKEKLNELKSFAKSPTWQNRNQAISAGSRSRNDSANTNTTGLLDTTMKELDEEMKQLRKTYSLHSNSVSSEGSFKSLVQNRRSDSSDKRVASRSPNLRTKKYPKHKSKQRSASSPVQAKAIHSPEPGKKSEQKIFDIRSAGLLSWNESIAMLTANYKSSKMRI